MALRVNCPSCDTEHTLRDELAGREVRCSKCGAGMVVPELLDSGLEEIGEGAAPATAAEPHWKVDRRVAPPPEPAAGGYAPPPDDDAETSGDGEREELVIEKGTPIDAEMDMTPMVDVTFLLLIFFMVTASFAMQKSIEIPKPKQDEASANAVPQDPEQDPEFVTVTVDENNTYRVITLDWEREAPSEQELLRQMREAKQGDSSGNVPTKLLVRAHTDSLHEKVVTALDAGVAVGMEQVQLMTVDSLE